MSTPVVEDLTYCEKHPEREASLRCIRCNRLMCTQCIVKTPTGYICKECARRAEDKFFHGTNNDYVIQGAVAFIAMGIGVAAARTMGIASTWLFAVFLGPALGTAVGELALRLTQRRRARYSDRVATAAGAAGGLVGLLVSIGPIPLQYVLSDFGFLIFLGLAVGAVFARFQVRI